MKSKKLLLTLREYDRIYSVIYSVLQSGNANTPHACMFFAIIGSVILNNHYKIPARPVAGAFFLSTANAKDKIISFGKREEGRISSDENGFHCWIQTESHIIDFMAPIFHESAKNNGQNLVIQRNMFQRLIADEVNSLDKISKAGDYFTIPNIDLTNELIDSFIDRPSHTDLLNASNRWFKKYPKKLDDLKLFDDLRNVYQLELKAPAISGAW